MSKEKTPAVYELFWYELDQPIAVDQHDAFHFRKNTTPICFHSGPADIISPKEILCTIESITHPELGAVKAITPAEGEYTITLEDGRSFNVDAEVNAGTVVEFPIQPSDWTFDVVVVMGKV